MSRSRFLFVVAALAVFAAPAVARTIFVSPGPGTPLQDAIDAALPRDTIKLAAGTYNEAIVIDKPLRLYGASVTFYSGSVIDAGCAATTALTIAANDVKVKKVTVTRGTFYTVDIVGRDRILLRQVTAEGFGCGTAQYGINVFDSTNVRLELCWARGEVGGYTGAGYQDAAIYIGGIPSEGNVRVHRSLGYGSNRGIILEDSTDMPGGKPTVLVQNGDSGGTTPASSCATPRACASREV